jgi:DMSO/TMAO reductase YedYZ molybdopterin-dependent catalytic subunit
MQMLPHATYRHRVAAHELTPRITPSSDVFVLAHFGVARIRAEDWRLQIAGLVEQTADLSLQQLRDLPKVELEAFIKCAGFPHDHTIATRNVSNAVWGGVRLSELLRRVGVREGAAFVWAFAPDHGSYAHFSSDCYIKDIPLSRAQADDVLLAYELNGEPLTPEHGFPVRLLVPGYYGTNSVKWLCRIEVSDRRASHLFTSELYRDPVILPSGEPSAERRPVWEVAPEALITSPAHHASLPKGNISVTGWSWGCTEISCVEISVDGGETWQRVRAEARHQMGWQKFSFAWSQLEAGEVTICARAIDRNGATQPAKDARNSIHKISVKIA